MDIYRENILDHYRNPRNFGELEKPDASYEGNNPFCGDQISFAFKVQPACRRGRGSRLKEIKFWGEGCAISMASASMLTEKVKNMGIEDLRKLNKDVILDMLGIRLSPTRLKCALLPLEVLQKAVSKFHE